MVVDSRRQLAVNTSLDALRVVAAIAVVLGHARALFFVDFPDSGRGLAEQLFYAVTSLGHPAVMAFFVLSGFWVGGKVMQDVGAGAFRGSRYAVDRLVRLWVVAVPALLLTAGVDAIGQAARSDADVYSATTAMYHGVATPSLAAHQGVDVLLGNVAFLQSIRVPTFGSNAALWSLAYEFWFYLLFPVLALAFQRRTRPVHRAALVLVAGATAVLVGPDVLRYAAVWSLGVVVHRASRSPQLAWLYDGAQQHARRVRAARVGALLAVLAALALVQVRPTFLADLVVGSACACLVAVTARDRGSRTGVLAVVGRYAGASYSLYAVHLPLLVLAAALVVPRAADRFLLSWYSLLVLAGVTGATLLAAWLFAQLTEAHTSRVKAALLGARRTRRSVRTTTTAPRPSPGSQPQGPSVTGTSTGARPRSPESDCPRRV